MSKVVSSKFGDRQLVQLPPVNFSRSRSTEVPSIVPNTNNRGDNADRSVVSVQRQYGNIEGSQSPQAVAEGNIVRDVNNIGVDYKIVQPSVGGANMHYTPYAMGLGQQYQPQPTQYQSPPQQNQPQPQQYQPPPQVQPSAVQPNAGVEYQSDNSNEKHIFYGLNGEVLPGPPSGFQVPGVSSNPNEKHIYYGPNGEVLPGPPQASSVRPKEAPQKEFVVEGVLHFGRLVTVYNVEYPDQFPMLPDYLLRTLVQKYGQFERTDVRIAYRYGEYNVHGVPHVPRPEVIEPPPPPPQQTVVEEPEEIIEYIYPDDPGYEEARREMERRGGVIRDLDDDVRSVKSVNEYRRDRDKKTTIATLDRDRVHRRYLDPEDRGHRRVVYHTHNRYWTARRGPEEEYYRKHNGTWTAPDSRDYRRRDVLRTEGDDPLDGLRWKKERATLSEERKRNNDLF